VRVGLVAPVLGSNPSLSMDVVPVRIRISVNSGRGEQREHSLMISVYSCEREDTPVPETEIKPTVKIIGENGNAFAILGACKKVARKAGWSDDRWKEFFKEALSGSYDSLLKLVMDHFEVE